MIWFSKFLTLSVQDVDNSKNMCTKLDIYIFIILKDCLSIYFVLNYLMDQLIIGVSLSIKCNDLSTPCNKVDSNDKLFQFTFTWLKAIFLIII